MRLAILLLAACAGASSPPPPRAPARHPIDLPMSDPAEYAIDRASADAGEAIFTRTGIGDPYKTGIPYPVFLALLRAYPDDFGATTADLAARFGFVARAPDPSSDDPDLREGLPLGMHLTIDPNTGVPFVVNSCVLCHAERVRWSGGDALVIGLGSKHVRIHAYDAAFVDVARRADFTAQRIAELADAAAKDRRIVWPAGYREALVDGTVAALRDRATVRAALVERTRDDPPGRVAPIESFAVALGQALGEDVAMAPDVGWSKVPDVIGFDRRLTLSWDAIGQGPIAVLVVEADFAAGVRPRWFATHPLQGASLDAYLRHPAPRPAFPGTIDRARAARGKTLFEDHCARCHGSYGDDGRSLDYQEQVVDLDEVGTDPARARAATPSFVRAANDPSLTQGATRVAPTGGYVPPVLTNVWMRAPYGHAGQWPSLAVMAMPPDQRPTQLVLQLDALYDLDAVGVATRAPGGALAPGEYLEDATRPGLSVLGHPFLADLGDEAPLVIEYLKTL